MRPFGLRQATDPASAATTAAQTPEAAYLAGGVTLIDLMKLDVMRPATIIDIGPLAGAHGAIEVLPGRLRLGALARMADAEAHPAIRRDFPVIAQSLRLAASQQLRNMATLGGNVLQRTRCPYFRDVGWEACNKRRPGSGCAALQGVNRRHAVLGVSDACIAAYPGDFAQALAALDASVELAGPGGSRRMPFEALHRPPGSTPHLETTLQLGELITGFDIATEPWMRRSLYLKVRDRASYDFALASAAVALDLSAGRVREARIALGGVAARPWRARRAEAALAGRLLDEAAAVEAARAAFEGAVTHGDNAFKAELGRRTLVEALLTAAQLEA